MELAAGEAAGAPPSDAAHASDQLSEVHGLDQEIVDAKVKGFDAGLGFRAAADHDQPHVAAVAQLSRQGHAVHTRQAEVHQHHLGAAMTQGRPAGEGVGRLDRLEPGLAQAEREGAAGEVLVLDDDDASVHGAPSGEGIARSAHPGKGGISSPFNRGSQGASTQGPPPDHHGIAEACHCQA